MLMFFFYSKDLWIHIDILTRITWILYKGSWAILFFRLSNWLQVSSEIWLCSPLSSFYKDSRVLPISSLILSLFLFKNSCYLCFRKSSGFSMSMSWGAIFPFFQIFQSLWVHPSFDIFSKSVTLTDWNFFAMLAYKSWILLRVLTKEEELIDGSRVWK